MLRKNIHLLIENKNENSCSISRGTLFPRYLQIMTKIIVKLRKQFKKNKSKLYSLTLRVEKLKFADGISYNLFTLKNLKRCSSRLSKMFYLVSKNMKAELGDLLLISPKQITDICNNFF